MSGDHNLKGQCPSCGGDCGRTAKSGCNYGRGPTDHAAVLKLVQKLSKVIGKERPIVVAQACLMLIKLSTDLEGK